VIKRFAALIVLFSILSVTIVHACSGLDGMRMGSLQHTSDNAMIAGEPCVQRKQDDHPCKSVRYRMLSTQAEPIQSQRVLLPSTLLDWICVENVLSLAALLTVPPWTAIHDSLFKHSPRFSHIVLRI
jgi:hypothetical protein